MEEVRRSISLQLKPNLDSGKFEGSLMVVFIKSISGAHNPGKAEPIGPPPNKKVLDAISYYNHNFAKKIVQSI